MAEIAALQHEVHQDAKALDLVQKSVEIYTNLVRSQPDQASYHSELGLSWNCLGVVHDDARRNAEALSAFEHAVKEQEIAIHNSRDSDEYKSYLCYHLDNLGEQFVNLGRVAEALPYYERSLRINRELRASHPKNRVHAVDLVKRLLVLGNLRRHEGVPAAARGLFVEAKSIVDHFLGTSPSDLAWNTRLCVALNEEARAMMDQGQPEKARPLLEHAVALFRPGLNHPASAPDLATAREARSEALWELARVLRALDQPQEASRVDAERIGLWNDCAQTSWSRLR